MVFPYCCSSINTNLPESPPVDTCIIIFISPAYSMDDKGIQISVCLSQHFFKSITEYFQCKSDGLPESPDKAKSLLTDYFLRRSRSAKAVKVKPSHLYWWTYLNHFVCFMTSPMLGRKEATPRHYKLLTWTLNNKSNK